MYVSGTISYKDMVSGAWNCQTVSGSGLGNAVWRAAIDMEMNSCIYNWKCDRKMSRSATAGEAGSVTAHEVINKSQPEENVRGLCEKQRVRQHGAFYG